MKPARKILFHRAYQIGIILKGVDGVLEIAAGMALLLTTQPAIQHVIALLTREELVEDPRDLLANYLMRMARHLSIGMQHFASIYLLVHGIVKAGLVICLLRGWHWAYPVALLLLTAFIFYQVYRLTQTPSLPLYFLTALDVVIVVLVWREWRWRPTRSPAES